MHILQTLKLERKGKQILKCFWSFHFEHKLSNVYHYSQLDQFYNKTVFQIATQKLDHSVNYTIRSGSEFAVLLLNSFTNLLFCLIMFCSIGRCTLHFNSNIRYILQVEIDKVLLCFQQNISLSPILCKVFVLSQFIPWYSLTFLLCKDSAISDPIEICTCFSSLCEQSHASRCVLGFSCTLSCHFVSFQTKTIISPLFTGVKGVKACYRCPFLG